MNVTLGSAIVESTPTASSGSLPNNVVATAAVVPVPSAPAVKNIDVCSFFTSVDAQPLVGTIEITISQGSDLDEVTGGQLDYCTYQGDDVTLLVSLATSNAAKDSQAWQDQLSEMTRATDPDAIITPFSDLGELSYWVITEESAGFSVAKFPYVFILAVGGNIGYPDDYKNDLQSLAQKILDALP